MADDSPPRKVSSLRDRIAQFEHKPAAAPALPPKPVVPKKTWAWKEKQAEAAPAPPPPAPASATSFSSSSSSIPAPEQPSSSDTPDPSLEKPISTGFSAEDAKVAISAGGGLKARLAALQGSGFGQPVDTGNVPPPPAGKPRVWKKAVVTYEPTYSTRPERHSEEEEAPAEREDHVEVGDDADQTQDAPPQDEVEDDRQRRAAIAARMARLGGARVGMPMVSGKPPVPPPMARKASTESESAAAAVVSPLVPEQGLEDPKARAESVLTETETTIEDTAESEDVEEEEEPQERVPIHAVPSSPPRPRPPIPATRAWSTSPPGSPQMKLRPEVVSQEGDGETFVGEVTGRGEGYDKEEGEGAEVGIQEDGGYRGDKTNLRLGEKKDGSGGGLEIDLKDEETASPPPLTLGTGAPTTAGTANERSGSPASGASPASLRALLSVKPSSASSPISSNSPQSATLAMPLPAIPKRAAPPRRKIPTPKPSTDSVPKIPTPPGEPTTAGIVPTPILSSGNEVVVETGVLSPEPEGEKETHPTQVVEDADQATLLSGEDAVSVEPLEEAVQKLELEDKDFSIHKHEAKADSQGEDPAAEGIIYGREKEIGTEKATGGDVSD